MIEAFTSQLELWNEKAKKKRFCRKKHKEHKDCKCYRGECSHGIYAGILFTLISTFYVSLETRLGLRLLLHRSATYVGRKDYISAVFVAHVQEKVAYGTEK